MMVKELLKFKALLKKVNHKILNYLLFLETVLLQTFTVYNCLHFFQILNDHIQYLYKILVI